MKKYDRMLSKPLGELLIAKEIITPDQLEEALVVQKREGGLIGEILIRLGFANEEAIAQALTMQYGLPYLPLTNYEIDPAVLSVVPRETAQKYCFIPIDKIGNNLTIAISNPLDYKTLESIEKLTGCVVHIFVSTSSHINEAINKYYQT
ncbi:MAG: hypothetical protein JW844_06705 [Candidatus Omnitrophica bacterium]|nr:hypothetical protein [Candidatus Omnitrophota bacterium]